MSRWIWLIIGLVAAAVLVAGIATFAVGARLSLRRAVTGSTGHRP